MQIPHIDTTPPGEPLQDVTGVILAGGRSSRMGRDKALLEVDGVPLFERVLSVMAPFFSRLLIAGERPDLARPDLPFVPDIYPGSALGGLHAGLTAAETPWIFVAACDMPYPSPALIRQILACRQGFDVVVPRTATGLEPLFALYGKGCLAPMEAMLRQGSCRIYDFYDEVKVRVLTAEELPAGADRAFVNINTPDDYGRATERKP
jgi:molybdopterin-guanine dinucleotide biosynthesis protein A